MVINKNTHRWFFLVLLIFFPISNSFGSDSTSASKTYALQFGISENFKLTSYEGSNISIKYVHKTNRALKLGISINGYMNKTSEENSFFGEIQYQHKLLDISLQLQYIFYMNTSYKILPFIGIGPFLRYKNSIDETEKSYTEKSYFVLDQIGESAKSIGITSNIGVEVFVHKNISLDAEYGTLVLYTVSKINETSKLRPDPNWDYAVVHKVTNKGNHLEVKPIAVIFGISIYF